MVGSSRWATVGFPIATANLEGAELFTYLKSILERMRGHPP